MHFPSMSIASVNPATGALLRAFPPHTDAEVERTLTEVAAAAAQWRHTRAAERSALLLALADRLDAEREALAVLATREMGKTLQSARDEVAKCATCCRHFAAHAPARLAPQLLEIDGASATLHHDPLGVILAVMPWNFPYWQFFRAAAPAIAAGNALVLKHASNVPECALAIERVVREAGAPQGLVRTLLVGAGRVAALVADPRIAAVTLTGSEAAGRDVAAHAGRHIKKTVLELGGSDPFIVLSSADPVAAATAAVRGRMINNGQSCVAAKRFIVDARVADAFESAFVEQVRALRVGDPMLPDIDIGPLATAQIRDELADQVVRSVNAGARVAVGGVVIDGPGFFYAPTVLLDVPRSAPAAVEETFGPVAPVFRAHDTADALRFANETPFGLGASVWTRDAREAEAAIAALDCGMVFLNAIVASDARFPFGGVKASGYGREVGEAGLLEFVNIKTVRGSVTG
jgi:succinate-semialdehyde dehydrogenase/glutarate-semialdehyde dehydrogenase